MHKNHACCIVGSQNFIFTKEVPPLKGVGHYSALCARNVGLLLHIWEFGMDNRSAYRLPSKRHLWLSLSNSNLTFADKWHHNSSHISPLQHPHASIPVILCQTIQGISIDYWQSYACATFFLFERPWQCDNIDMNSTKNYSRNLQVSF